jgi:hypothetical protein
METVLKGATSLKFGLIWLHGQLKSQWRAMMYEQGGILKWPDKRMCDKWMIGWTNLKILSKKF